MKQFVALFVAILMPIFTFAQETMGLDQKIDYYFGQATGWFVSLIFYQIPFTDDIKVFWVLFPMILGALYFTIIFRVPGFRLFHIAI
ncbi:MAG: AGCS family alanine or glycine:cation symporter, partial [Bacteroidia bacterium]